MLQHEAGRSRGCERTQLLDDPLWRPSDEPRCDPGIEVIRQTGERRTLPGDGTRHLGVIPTDDERHRHRSSKGRGVSADGAALNVQCLRLLTEGVDADVGTVPRRWVPSDDPKRRWALAPSARSGSGAVARGCTCTSRNDRCVPSTEVGRPPRRALLTAAASSGRDERSASPSIPVRSSDRWSETKRRSSAASTRASHRGQVRPSSPSIIRPGSGTETPGRVGEPGTELDHREPGSCRPHTWCDIPPTRSRPWSLAA